MSVSKKNISWGIRLLISFLFLLSAVAKLYPSPYFAISTFEVKQLYPLGFSEGFAPYFSRILIGIEFALGFYFGGWACIVWILIAFVILWWEIYVRNSL